jgi:hypothetical protein
MLHLSFQSDFGLNQEEIVNGDGKLSTDGFEQGNFPAQKRPAGTVLAQEEPAALFSTRQGEDEPKTSFTAVCFQRRVRQFVHNEQARAFLRE